MKKRVLNYILPLALVLATIGATLVLSQVPSPSGPNPGHHAKDVSGANGWFFVIDGNNQGTPGIPLNTVAPPNDWEDEPATATFITGMTSWNGVIVEIACDTITPSNPLDGSIFLTGGSQYNTAGSTDVIKYNHRIMAIYDISVVPYYDVYISGVNAASGNNPSVAQVLRLRLPSATATSLQFQRIFNPATASTIPNEAEANSFECTIKVLSKCYGQTGYPIACAS